MEFSQRSTRHAVYQNSPIPAATEEAWKNLYCADKNPNGVINLAVAENLLLQDWLVQEFKETFDLQPSDLCYQAIDGPIRFKEAICYVLDQYFNPFIPVKPEHLICGSGVTAIIAQLFHTICDEGAFVLISKPYYSGFDYLNKQGVTLIGVEFENPLDPQSVFAALENVYKDGNNAWKINDGDPTQKIKAVMLSNPHNPLGNCASKNILTAYCKFCEKYQLHLLVDEIYALSVFKDDDNNNLDSTGFISALSLNPADFGFDFDPSRLHVLYGISKDFGCGGLRAGVLISQKNPNLLAFIKKLNLNQVQISSLTAISFFNLVFSKIKIDDKHLLDSYIANNKKQLLQSYEYVTGRLNSLQIKYNKRSNSGFFLMIDLSKYLSHLVKSNQTEEESCFLRLLNEHKLLLAPGRIFHYPEPGFFRLTFTIPRDHLEVGLQRLAEFVQSFETTITSSIKNLAL